MSVWRKEGTQGMKSQKQIRNARMRKAYQYMRDGESTMAMLYAYSANSAYPLALCQIKRFNALVKNVVGRKGGQ